MDYSASIQDADHPAGASPWGSSPASSPQAQRTNFGAVAAEPPASPTPFDTPISRNGFGAAHEGGFEAPEHGFERPGTAESDIPTQTMEATSGLGNVSAGQHQSGPFRDENVSPSQAHEPNQISGDDAHASQAEHQVRRPTQPMYKLQAKITGLERAARKDPILRFDVHVSISLRVTDFRCDAESRRQTSLISEPPNSVMSGACTPSSSSWPSI